MEKMYETSPSSLQDLSLNAICYNVEDFIEPVDEKLEETDLWENPAKEYRFRDPELCLHNELSEKLMTKMIENDLLFGSTMFLFNSKNTALRNVRLRDCEVGQDGLQVLKQHKISKLECSNLWIDSDNSCSISMILDSLNEWTIANMTDANFSKCTAIELYSTRSSLRKNIPNMKNLRNLNLSWTKLDQISLEIICEGLKLLEKLDISGTSVKNLKPLMQLSDRLIGLSIRDLFNVKCYSYTILKLTKLRFLDVSISRRKRREDPDSYFTPLYNVLANTHSLPELRSLDISGWRNFVPNTMIMNYVAAHPKLRYFGCVLNDISSEIGLRKVAPPDLVIGGLGDDMQIEVALVVYRDKSDYAQKALWYLSQLTRDILEPRQDLFDLVLSVMAAHPYSSGVLGNATYCLLNLTLTNELTEKIHPQALSVAVDLMLDAMENFPEKSILQDSLLSALCNSTILENINFNHFRCAELALDAICTFYGHYDIKYNATFICSVLTANASSEETRKLGARSNYMQQLLDIIRGNIYVRWCDDTLDSTLQVLFNMTCETATCTVFLDQGGDILLLDMLETLYFNADVVFQVLSVLLNVIKDMVLRSSPVLDPLLIEISDLLKSEYFGVSSLAAVVVNYYSTLCGYVEWNVNSHSRDEMLRVINATPQWKELDDDDELNYCLSFRPFLLLLRTDMKYQVQLLAVSFIHHKCTVAHPYKAYYCSMLHKEGGHLVLHELIQCSETHPEIKKISSLILEIVAKQVV